MRFTCHYSFILFQVVIEIWTFVIFCNVSGYLYVIGPNPLQETLPPVNFSLYSLSVDGYSE
jgi:hypothetical protein